MIQMELSKVLITETSDYQVIWLREKGGERTFPILIGIIEADAIARKLRDVKTLRPLTHDLMANVIIGLGATVDRVVVNSLRKNTFYAKIVLRLNGSSVEIDSRPSDAVAVAVRLEAPIFVEDHVLEHVCSGTSSPQSEELPPPDDPTIV